MQTQKGSAQTYIRPVSRNERSSEKRDFRQINDSKNERVSVDLMNISLNQMIWSFDFAACMEWHSPMLFFCAGSTHEFLIGGGGATG